jgi:hypothetical protein
LPEGLKLPETVGGLYLSGCTLPEGLKLPETVGGGLYLSGCTLPEGLKLPETVGGKKVKMLAFDGEYILFVATDMTFSAGCAANLSKAEALKRWNRTDARAVLFTKSIRDWSKK